MELVKPDIITFLDDNLLFYFIIHDEKVCLGSNFNRLK